MISSAEWRWLEAALIQRARLFDAMLADLYGAQNLMREGLRAAGTRLLRHRLPAPLPRHSARSRRRCSSMRPISRAATTATGASSTITPKRSPASALRSPTASCTRTSPATCSSTCNARPARAVLPATCKSTLTQHAAAATTPRIALLTPGPHHEDYFSHAYLARYLGYLLVEGSDLRTQGNQVYLKTLEGLKEIDLIVRCVDGRSIDPLELDPGGFDGPAGLLRVCRSQPRLVVNAVGSALAQNRGLGRYLPQICASISSARNWRCPTRPAGGSAIRQRARTCSPISTASSSARRRKAPAARDRPRSARTRAHCPTPSATSLKREIELHGARSSPRRRSASARRRRSRATGLAAAPVRRALLRRPHRRTAIEAMPGGLAMTVDPDRAVALSAPDGHTRDVWVLVGRASKRRTSACGGRRSKPRASSARSA